MGFLVYLRNKAAVVILALFGLTFLVYKDCVPVQNSIIQSCTSNPIFIVIGIILLLAAYWVHKYKKHD